MSVPLRLKVLVTGGGGDIGLAVGRILRRLDICSQIWASDTHEKHAGRAVFDECHTLELASNATYVSSLEKLVAKLAPDIVIPIAEPEIRRLHSEKIYGKTGKALLITANPTTLEIGFDKLETARKLESLKLPFPWTVPAESMPKNLPCIAKTRAGSGSRSISIVQTADEAKVFLAKGLSDGIWQEYLDADEEEYTCGVFQTPSTGLRTIQFRRKLQGGLTGSGEVVNNSEIGHVLKVLAEGLELRGSMNVQLRLTQNGPKVFEINPRFSSTVMFRDKLGFRDVLWSIQDALGLPVDRYSPAETGTKFFRTSDEVFFDAHGDLLTL